MAAKYELVQTQPWTYLDGLSNPVNGFRVTILLKEFGETHFVNVPSMDAVGVKRAIDALVAQREALAKLG